MFDLFGDYNESDLLFLGDWGVWAVVGMALMGLLVVGLSWIDLRDMRGRRRWTLITLRAAVYLLAVMMLLEPALELKNITRVKNHIAVLLDTSLSHSLKAEGETTRLQRAQEALKDSDFQKLLTEPNEDHVFDLFTFSDKPSSGTFAEATHPGLKPTGEETRILESIEDVTRTIGKRDLGGVIVLSDGIDSGILGGRVRPGEKLDKETSAFLTRLGAPVHTMLTANTEDLKDLSVEKVLYDDFAFVRNKISIDVVLKVVNFEPARIPISLYKEGNLLQTREVEVGPDATEYKVSFELVPQQIGKEIYTVSAPSFEGEALHENNRKDIILKIIRDKIRVLHVVGQPSWDERFLRQLLKRNPNVDLISFFILRTAENPQVGSNNELSLIPFPTRELFEQQLGSFDLIIFQNFNYGPYRMRQYLPKIAKYVKDGGGFVMLGGDLSLGSGDYQNTALSEVIPFVLPPQNIPEVILNETPFKLQVSEAGLRHPITQLAFDPVTNQKRWDDLPELEGTNIVMGARPGATVLGTHPTQRHAGQPMPVLAVQDVGKGRSMAITTDSSWRWSFDSVAAGGTARPYHTFWNAAIRWLIKDPELKLLRIEMEDISFLPGEEVPVRVRISNSDYTPAANAEGLLEVIRTPLKELIAPPAPGTPGESSAIVTQTFTTDARGYAEITIPDIQTGAYAIRASAKTGAGDLQDQDLFLVTLDGQELRNIAPREDLLKSVAEASKGSFHRLPDLDVDDLDFKEARVVQVNRRKVIDLWDTFYVFALICALLAIEWSLRRRWGRL